MVLGFKPDDWDLFMTTVSDAGHLSAQEYFDIVGLFIAAGRVSHWSYHKETSAEVKERWKQMGRKMSQLPYNLEIFDNKPPIGFGDFDDGQDAPAEDK